MNTSRLFPRPHPQTAGRVIDGEAVLILSEVSQVKVLNGVGSRVFELADGRRSVQSIAATIAAEYDVDLETAEHDLSAFLQTLVDQGVLLLAEEEFSA